MPVDDMPPSESEGAIPYYEEKGKCAAFLEMPFDDMPPSESEGAIHCYKEKEKWQDLG